MKNKHGFTLVEVIISIGALGIICAVLLRLFVLAGDTNVRAQDTQCAQLHAASAAETFAAADTAADALRALGVECSGEPEGRYSFSQDGVDITVDLEKKDGGYPGTLYNLTVTASDGEADAQIETAKYYKEHP